MHVPVRPAEQGHRKYDGDDRCRRAQERRACMKTPTLTTLFGQLLDRGKRRWRRSQQHRRMRETFADGAPVVVRQVSREAVFAEAGHERPPIAAARSASPRDADDFTAPMLMLRR